MGISPFYKSLRERVGRDLLLVPAVSALVHDNEGCLLVHQRPDGSWSLPAGAIEPGETPAQAIVRETFEETGFHVVPERVVAVLGGESCRVRNAKGEQLEYLLTVFACRVVGGRPSTDSDETTAIAFLPPNDVRARVAFPIPDAVYDSNLSATYFQEHSPAQ
jgi:8-oxo-dGTP pyrophosphatase MutT (NUDIX family)